VGKAKIEPSLYGKYLGSRLQQTVAGVFFKSFLLGLTLKIKSSLEAQMQALSTDILYKKYIQQLCVFVPM
jgi:hypothetical protein